RVGEHLAGLAPLPVQARALVVRMQRGLDSVPADPLLAPDEPATKDAPGESDDLWRATIRAWLLGQGRTRLERGLDELPTEVVGGLDRKVEPTGPAVERRAKQIHDPLHLTVGEGASIGVPQGDAEVLDGHARAEW